MPLKLRMGAGTFGASRLSVETRLFWMTGSGVSWCRYGTFGFSFASCSAFKSDAFHRGILRSGGEISFLYEAPTVRPLDCWFAFGACADNDPAENKPSPTSASKIAIEQRTKLNRMRGLKKADSDGDFVFMGDLRETIDQAGRMSRFIYTKSAGLFGPICGCHTGRNAPRQVGYLPHPFIHICKARVESLNRFNIPTL